jgi:hypothetical protein
MYHQSGGLGTVWLCDVIPGNGVGIVPWNHCLAMAKHCLLIALRLNDQPKGFFAKIPGFQDERVETNGFMLIGLLDAMLVQDPSQTIIVTLKEKEFMKMHFVGDISSRHQAT